jgi:hypothetical protein
MSEPKSFSEKPGLRERMRKECGDVQSLPPEPPGMTTSIAATGNVCIMSIPEPGGFRNSVAYVIYSVVFGLVIGWYFVWPILSVPSPDFIRVLVGGFFTLLMVGPLLGALKHFLLRKTRVTIVTISPAFFRIEERNGYKSEIKEIPVDELKDLILPAKDSMTEDMNYAGSGKWQFLRLIKFAPTPGITAVSDRAILTFGRGLPEPELSYIYSLIRKTIAEQ